MHLGNVFAALVAWLSARAEGGSIVLRIEDLDPRAQHPGVAETLMRDLEWLGLTWDEGPFWQSERGEVYAEALERLSEQGLLYPCFCTRVDLRAASAPHASDGALVYPGTCRGLSPRRSRAARRSEPPRCASSCRTLTTPPAPSSFATSRTGRHREVLVRDCGDFLVRRSDGVVAYQLAVVVDDALMGVTQVVRGHDLLPSCARQTYLARLLGWEPPQYGHVPLLVAPDGRRLAKRDRDLDLGALRERGVHAEKIIGTLAAAAGLADPGCEASPAELVQGFSWNKVAAHHEDVIVDEVFLDGLLS